MTEPRFRPGDTVILKSGGPWMTVRNASPATKDHEAYYGTDWFDGYQRLQSAVFTDCILDPTPLTATAIEVRKRYAAEIQETIVP